MKSLLLIATVLLFSVFANAAEVVDTACFPTDAKSEISKAILWHDADQDYDNAYSVEVVFKDGTSLKTISEYADDVDYEYYVSKDETLFLGWEWSPMNNDHKADGELRIEKGNSRKVFKMECFAKP